MDEPRERQSTRLPSMPADLECPSLRTGVSPMSGTSSKLLPLVLQQVWSNKILYWSLQPSILKPQLSYIWVRLLIPCRPCPWITCSISPSSHDGSPSGRNDRGTGRVLLCRRSEAQEVQGHGIPGCHGEAQGQSVEILQVCGYYNSFPCFNVKYQELLHHNGCYCGSQFCSLS